MSLVYEIITNRIIEKLEEGVIPWKKPWNGPEGHPRNINGRHYSGINSFLLACSPYSSPYWLTFRQIKEIGGCLKKGSKSSQIIFWKSYEKNLSSVNGGSGMGEENLETVLVLRYYNVFSIEQCNGINPPEKEKPVERLFTPIEEAERVIKEMPNRPEIEHRGNSAYYDPMLDKVVSPSKEYFESDESYYSTMFHELSHSTGHKDRLNRNEVTDIISFGSDAYSREELVAEMGSAFLCAHAGIEEKTINNSSSYISGWLKKLKSDKKMLIVSASRAQKAADLILGKL